MTELLTSEEAESECPLVDQSDLTELLILKNWGATAAHKEIKRQPCNRLKRLNNPQYICFFLGNNW